MKINDEIISDFRRVMKAFSYTTKWPSEVIQLQLVEADSMTGGSMWGSFVLDDDANWKKRGMYYLCAHYLVSYYGVAGAKDPTKVSPEARLNVSSQQVGDESVTYRITEMEPTVTDFISTTIYGVKFLELRKHVCVGAIAI